jgi:SAM-dependent methyltransferase
MLNQLREIVETIVVKPVGIKSLALYEGTLNCPSKILEFTQAFCHLAQKSLPQDLEVLSEAELSAVDLISYFAKLPDWISFKVRRNNVYKENIEKAWEEPIAGAFVGVCATVQDVWSHLLGLESQDDPILLKMINSGHQRILDYGCGAGYFSIALARRGVRVDAFDIDPVKTDFLKFRVQENGLDALVHVGAQSGFYDAILALNVLDHLEHPQNVIKHLSSWLNPKGKLYVVSEFPADGWHQSDPSVKKRVVDTLLADFCIVKTQANLDGPSLEVFEVGGEKNVISSLHEGAMLKLQDGVVFSPIETEEGLVQVSSRSFYCDAAYIDEAILPLLKALGESKSLIELCEEHKWELSEITPVLQFLIDARLVNLTGALIIE